MEISKRLKSRITTYATNPQYLLKPGGQDFLRALKENFPEQYDELKSKLLGSEVKPGAGQGEPPKDVR